MVNNIKNKEINLKITECNVILGKLAYKFTSNPEDIQDLVQETMMRSLKHIDQFFLNPKIVAWLYVIMKHIYINQYRRQKQKHIYEKYKANETYDMGYLEPSNSNHVDGEFIISDVNKLLSRYPQEHKEIFSKFIDGYKYKELSAYYNIPEGTIKSRIHTIRKSLRKTLVRLN